MEEAKTRNGRMEGIQDNLGMLEGGSGSGAGGERKDERIAYTVTTNSWRVLGACWVPAGRQQSANHVTSLTELSEHKTHFYVLKTMHIYIYTNIWGKHMTNIHQRVAAPGNRERGLSLLG